MDLCACGCGAAVKPGRAYVSGHNGRGKRKPRVERACQFCGGIFSGTKKAIGARVYCSSSCRDEHRRASTGELNRCYRRVEVPCAICGKPVKALPSALEKRQDQYCSPECGREGRSRKIRGVPKQASHWRTLAKRVYGDRCVLCGFSHAVDVHHILPRSKGGSNDLNNLVPLCPNHHVMVHLGMIQDEELLAARAGVQPLRHHYRLGLVHASHTTTRPAEPEPGRNILRSHS